MKYVQHDHDTKPGHPYILMIKAPIEIHELLEHKRFFWQLYSDYYSFGHDAEWEGRDPINRRPYICVYENGSWDGRAVEGYPMQSGNEIIDYLNSLP